MTMTRNNTVWGKNLTDDQGKGIRLVPPQTSYLSSYAAASREFEAEKPGRNKQPVIYNAAWQDAMLYKFRKEHLGLAFEPAIVPQSTYWLARDDEYIGTGNIRHWLLPHLMLYGGHIGYSIRKSRRGQGFGGLLLGLLLHKARERGLPTALIMCDSDNIASRRIIEKNGGQLHDIINIELNDKPRTMCRYLAET